LISTFSITSFLALRVAFWPFSIACAIIMPSTSLYRWRKLSPSTSDAADGRFETTLISR